MKYTDLIAPDEWLPGYAERRSRFSVVLLASIASIALGIGILSGILIGAHYGANYGETILHPKAYP